MADPLTAAIAASTILTAGSAIQQGRAQKAMADFESKQLAQSAKTEESIAQREASEERRKAAEMRSNIAARMASGGLSTADVGGASLLSDVTGLGEYNALAALWEGSERAAGRTMQSQARTIEGRQSSKASKMNALSTVISGASQYYGKR